MSAAAGRAARLGARYAARYGPQAALAWKVAGSHAVDAAAVQIARRRERGHAIDQARTLVEGTVLRTRHGDEVVWIVFSGQEAVAAHPDVGEALPSLVSHVDLAKRRTPEEIDAARLRSRSRRVVTDRVRRPAPPAGPDPIEQETD